jgi:hypothetical protein
VNCLAFGLVLVTGGAIGILFELDGMLGRGQRQYCCRNHQHEPEGEFQSLLHNSLRKGQCTNWAAERGTVVVFRNEA